MRPSPSVCLSKPRLAAMLALNGLCLPLGCSVSAQVVTTPYQGSPLLGLRGLQAGGEATPFAPPAELKGGFTWGLGVTTTYDSNFFLSQDHPQSELTTDVLPWIKYYSDPTGGAPFSLSANYQPNIRTYLNNSNLDGIDHSGGVSLKAQGAKTLLEAYLNYSTLSGTDRLSGTFVTGTDFTAGMRATYQIAPRTSLFANLSFDKTDYGSSTMVGSDIFMAQVGGFWSATERFSLGPAFSFTRDQSENTGIRDIWSLSMQARYLLGNKLQFIAALGLQDSTNSREAGKSSLGLTGGLTASYAINERLQWDTSVQYNTVPSATDVNYVVNNLSVSTILTRQLLRSSVGLGVEMNFADYTGVGTVNTNVSNQDNLSIFLSYHRKLFSDRVDFDSSIHYSVNRGDADWSQWQITAGLRYAF